MKIVYDTAKKKKKKQLWLPDLYRKQNMVVKLGFSTSCGNYTEGAHVSCTNVIIFKNETINSLLTFYFLTWCTKITKTEKKKN